MFMVDEQEAGARRRPRRFRTSSEKRRIAELTFEPGASVALIARAHGVNANQVFKWRRTEAGRTRRTGGAGGAASSHVVFSQCGGRCSRPG